MIFLYIKDLWVLCTLERLFWHSFYIILSLFTYEKKRNFQLWLRDFNRINARMIFVMCFHGYFSLLFFILIVIGKLEGLVFSWTYLLFRFRSVDSVLGFNCSGSLVVSGLAQRINFPLFEVEEGLIWLRLWNYETSENE